MNRVFIAVAVVTLSACQTKTPTNIGTASETCYAAGHTMRTQRGCIESQLTRDYPQWRNDKDAPAVNDYLSYLDTLGELVTEGRISNAEAKLKAHEYLNGLRANANAQSAQNAQNAASSASAIGALIMGVGAMSGGYRSAPRTCVYNRMGNSNTVVQNCN